MYLPNINRNILNDNFHSFLFSHNYHYIEICKDQVQYDILNQYFDQWEINTYQDYIASVIDSLLDVKINNNNKNEVFNINKEFIDLLNEPLDTQNKKIKKNELINILDNKY